MSAHRKRCTAWMKSGLELCLPWNIYTTPFFLLANSFCLEAGELKQAQVTQLPHCLSLPLRSAETHTHCTRISWCTPVCLGEMFAPVTMRLSAGESEATLLPSAEVQPRSVFFFLPPTTRKRRTRARLFSTGKSRPSPRLSRIVDKEIVIIFLVRLTHSIIIQLRARVH